MQLQEIKLWLASEPPSVQRYAGELVKMVEQWKCDYQSVDDEVQQLRARCEESERLASRLANDALVALSGIVCTPAEGYLKAPHCLKGDIRALRSRCEAARAEAFGEAAEIAETMFHDHYYWGWPASRIAAAIRERGKVCTTHS